MSTHNSYFVINETLRVAPQHIRISGDLILKGERSDRITVDVADGRSPDKNLLPPTVRWILPPRSSEFYSRIKGFAEGAGYQTAEHDAPR